MKNNLNNALDDFDVDFDDTDSTPSEPTEVVSEDTGEELSFDDDPELSEEDSPIDFEEDELYTPPSVSLDKTQDNEEMYTPQAVSESLEENTDESEQDTETYEHSIEENENDALINNILDNLNNDDNEDETYTPEQNTNEEVKEDIEQDQTYNTETVETEQESKSKIENLILYIIADKNNPGLLNYFRGYGVHVSRIFTNLAEARDTLLMQVEPIRLIVMDTGTGKFTNMASRKSLIDLMGICDTNTKISVFYTDTVIKNEIQTCDEVDNKTMEFKKYKSTADVLANILQTAKHENYVYDMEDAEDDTVNESILNITGLQVKCGKSIDLGLPTILPSEIKMNMMDNPSEEGVLESYNIKI